MFLDADFLAKGDVTQLFTSLENVTPEWSVAAVIRTQERKFENAAMMMFNNEHPDNEILTPEYVETAKQLLTLGWTRSLYPLDPMWHHLVLYEPPMNHSILDHYTAGIPMYPETYGCEGTGNFEAAIRGATYLGNWQEIMGPSVHVQVVKDWHDGRKRNDPQAFVDPTAGRYST